MAGPLVSRRALLFGLRGARPVDAAAVAGRLAQAEAGTIVKVAAGCDLPPDDVARFYEWFVATPRSLTIYSQGVNQSAHGTDKVNAIINTHLLMAAKQFGAQRYFYASSACVYNADKQRDPNVTALKEEDAYPAEPEEGYGWEKLFSEKLCQYFTEDKGLPTRVARFHNVYGPIGTYEGGREKAPAAICRKVIQAKDSGTNEIMIWGDGTQTRSFTYIDDCVLGIDKIIHCDELIATPINLGSSELISVDDLVSLAEEIGNVKLTRQYDLTAPRGVAGRNSDNTFIKQVFGWEPSTPFKEGLAKTYAWIEQQYYARKAGERVVEAADAAFAMARLDLPPRRFPPAGRPLRVAWK